MWDTEIRFCSWGTAAMLLSWAGAGGLLVAAWLTGQVGLGSAGLAFAVFGGALLVVRDNAKTRRVVRAVAMTHDAAAVRPLR